MCWKWQCILDLLRIYQTIVAGVLALLGVSCTLLWNGYLTRRERTANIAHEAAALRVSLLTELQHLRDVLEWRIQEFARLKSAGGDSLALPNVAFTDVYRNSMSRLGLLPPSVLPKILSAYIPANHLFDSLRRFHRAQANVPEYYVVVGQRDFDEVSRLHSERLSSIRNAIGALEDTRV